MLKELTFERKAILKGYYKMLEQAPCNGACIHLTRQYITVLRLKLELNRDISPEYEAAIKSVLHRIYSVDISASVPKLSE